METLTANHPLTRAYFVENEVIFKINTDIYSEDVCLKTNGLAVYADPTATGDTEYVNEGKVPCFNVTETATGEETKYFLDQYISTGDKFDGTKFEKVIHGEEDTTSAFTAYFNSLCQDKLERYVMANYNKTFDELFGKNDDFSSNGFDISKLKKIDIPVWIIADNGKYTIEETEYYITLTETTFNEIIEKGTKKEIYKNAVATANKYGFDLTVPAKYDDIEITKQE